MSLAPHAPGERAGHQNIVEVLSQLGPEKGVTFVLDGNNERRVDYRQLDTFAQRIAHHLLSLASRHQTPVIIALDQPEAFVKAFWGAMVAGHIPVPLKSPNSAETRLKLLLVFQQCQQALWISNGFERDLYQEVAEKHGLSETLDALERTFIDYRELEQLQPFTTPPVLASKPILPSDLAFIQFSSGSTGTPKGVMITHRQLMTHLRDWQETSSLQPDDRFLSWFPLTHDMGLIGWHLLPVFMGADHCLMPTKLFVVRPSLWMSKTSSYRANVLCTNNFGLKHFLKLSKPEHKTGWDLSSVRLLFNAAEPISAEVCEEFDAYMHGTGLAHHVMYPGYGLAEATLGVSFPLPGEPIKVHVLDRRHLGIGDRITPPRDPSSAVSIVEIGRRMKYGRFRIADLGGQVLPEAHVGEIQFQSESATPGYYFDNQASSGLFTEDGWVKTGDLGFVIGDRLTVTGRLKEILIQAGVNYYPQDLERVAQQVEGVELGKVVACSVPIYQAQQELIVIFLVHKGSVSEFLPLANAVKTHVTREVGCVVDFVVPIRSVPKTTSGKIQRVSLALRFQEGEFDDLIQEMQGLSPGETERDRQDGLDHHLHQVASSNDDSRQIDQHALVKTILSICVELGLPSVRADVSLFEQGLDSRKSTEFVFLLERSLNRSLPVSLPFDYPSAQEMASHLSAANKAQTSAIRLMDRQDEPIAVIGMSCRMPGGIDSPGALWKVLTEGGDVVSGMPPSRGHASVLGGFLEDVAGFDHRFFNMSNREAQGLDPQARLTLELVWEALEHAGIDPESLRGMEVATCIGVSNVDYAGAQYRSGVSQRMDTYSYTGIANSMIAGRVAHLFDFKGPALSIDTACSSSLVAVDAAVKALRSGDGDLAVAGGVNLVLTPHGHECLTLMGALSPTGKCRPFSALADGYVRSEGAGFVILKPLSQAIRDRDTIWAVIAATATNHDGHSSGLTVPNGPSQARLIRKAIQQSGLSPDDIAYLEAHGTGTPLGDPIELGALQEVFGQRKQESKLLTGSIKGNIGHLESAAGIAGLLKAILITHHRIAPASLHADRLTDKVDWSRLAVEVNHRQVSLSPSQRGLWVGVSSFGFAGTNAHAIVGLPSATWAEPSQGDTPPDDNTGQYLFAISAKSTTALHDQARQWARLLRQDPGLHPQRIASLSTVHRAHFPHRTAIQFETTDELSSKLDQFTTASSRSGQPARLAFVFSGQGGQWPGMGMALYQHSPVFKDAMDRCDAMFVEHAGLSVIQELADTAEATSHKWLRTDLAQMAIFALQVAWTAWLKHHGIRADGVVGHSCGEVAACWASGALSLEEAARLIVKRGRLMQQLGPAGRMLSVRAHHQDLQPRLPEGLSLASVNSPSSCVVAGEEDKILLFKAQLDTEQIHCRLIDGGFAFHTQAMHQAATELAKLAPGLVKPDNAVELYSTVTGTRLDQPIDGSDYWYRNVRDPVVFADAILSMANEGYTHYLEIGPHPVLLNLIAECQPAGRQVALIASLKRGGTEAALLETLSQAYESGLKIDWRSLYPKSRMPLSGLPSYPWQRTRHWQEGFDPWHAQAQDTSHLEIERLLWTTQLDAPVVTAAELKSTDHHAVPALHWHASFPRQDWPAEIRLNGTTKDDANQLLPDQGRPAIHVWFSSAQTVDQAAAEMAGAVRLINTLTQGNVVRGKTGVATLVFVAQAVALGMHEGLFALARVAENEYPNLRIKRLLIKDMPSQDVMASLVRYLGTSHCRFSECLFDGSSLFPFRMAPGVMTLREVKIRPERAVLVTGGYGSLGRVIAAALVKKGAKNVILVGRRAQSAAAMTSKAMLEAMGATVFLEQADVGLRGDMQRLFGRLQERALELDGVVHAAGVLSDQRIAQIDPGQIREHLSAKVDGAWLLHELTQAMDLNFFVCISSFAVTLGNPGQGIYAAANGLLDALTVQRRAAGLPGLSLRLGLIEGTTMAGHARDSLAREGVEALPLSCLDQHIVALMGSHQPVVHLADFTPARWHQAHPTSGVADFLSRWVEDTQEIGPARAAPELCTQLPQDLDFNQYLLERIASVTKTPVHEIDPAQPFWELGLDSMLTMQLRNQIAQEIGLDVHITTFWAYSTIHRYAEFLRSEMDASNAQAVQLQPAPTHPENTTFETDALAGKWEKYL